MITDEKDGIKIAENSEEALWLNVKKEAEALIRQSKNHLIIQTAMSELADEKLKPFSKA